MSRVLARIGAALLAALAVLASARAEPPKLPVPAIDQSAVALRGYFYVGGHYVGDPGKEILQGQIYVEDIAFFCPLDGILATGFIDGEINHSHEGPPGKLSDNLYYISQAPRDQ